MAEQGKTMRILITQCLQNGFFFEGESRLSLPVDEALRVLVGSPRDFDVQLEDPQDTTAIDNLVKTLRIREQRTAFAAFLKTKYAAARAETVSGSAPESETETDTESTDTPSDSPPQSRRRLMQNINTARKVDILAAYGEFIQERAKQHTENQRLIPAALLRQGPLHQFLEAVATNRPEDDTLHLIAIRDWHLPSESYDEERRRYGAHCEADTWAAEPLQGYEQFLLPDAPNAASINGYHDEERRVTFYDVKSESLFDFKPGDQIRGGITAESTSPGEDQDTLLEQILHNLLKTEKPDRVYVVVIGVYTDIKIKLLLTGLASNYDIQNLITSDILTAAPSLERHLAGLDFADKVLDVEIIHSLNDLAQVLNPARTRHRIPQTVTENSINFRNYRTYFLDKQYLLGYQDQRLNAYLELTKRRAARVYRIILRANIVLMVVGTAFLVLAFLGGLLGLIDPNRMQDDYLIGTGLLGGIGIAQLIAVFYSAPIRQLQSNLNNLVQLQATLETHSLILALMRHHFSRPERLYSQGNTGREADELANLKEQIDMIMAASKSASEQFAGIGQIPGDEDTDSELSN